MFDSPSYRTSPRFRKGHQRLGRGYPGHRLPAAGRAVLAARDYEQKRPIEAPTLQQLALAYHVSVASIQRARNGKPVTVEEAARSWGSWTPQERSEFGRRVGVADIWDDAIVPTIAEERPPQQAAE